MRAVLMPGTLVRRVAALSPLRRLRFLMLVAGGSLATGGLAGCGALDVSDPTAVEESELNDAAGAELLRHAAVRRLAEIVSAGAFASGLLADEFLSEPPVWATPGTWPNDVLNRRESVQYETLESFDPGGYTRWKEVRRAAAVALPKFRAHAPADVRAAKVGEMFVLRGFAALRLAEDFCPGFPLHDIVDLQPVYTAPLSTEAAFTAALAEFDSAVTYAVDSARILHFAQVGRARTLLGLGRFAEAGAAVDGVPTDYVTNVEYSQSVFLTNGLYLDPAGLFWSVADREGGTGLDFVTAQDPRVVTDSLGLAADGVTGLYGIGKYSSPEAPIVLASGIEARLIEAEAALHDGGDWLGILNALRTNCTDAATCPDPAPAGDGGVDSLPPLTDPGTEAGRIALLFRERAFWLFATGHRLADLRRLVQHYGRPAESVFPTGAHRLGGTYGTATSIPFPAARETTFNPAVTGCTSR